jgi:DNA-binding transcriptional ArsR family regulator
MIELELASPSTHRVRFGVSPLEEALGAVQVILGLRGHPAYLPWLETARKTAAGLPIDGLRLVLSARHYITDFLSPPPDGPQTSAELQLAAIRRTPLAQVATELAMVDADLGDLPADPARARDRLADEMAIVWAELVEPHWPRMRAVLDEDIAYRSRRLAEGGIRLLFAELHPRVRLVGDALLIESSARSRTRLDRRGLLLIPATFAWPGVGVMAVSPWQPSLLYPARGVARLWAPEPPVGHARLAAVIGRTKATLLLALNEPAGTSDLATRLGLAASTVSAHLTALRAVGILTALRSGHQVRYRRTDLGESLLAGLR